MNPMAGANATTHHHLNVTLGEDKFYYTANNDNAANIGLPNITQTGSSGKLKAQFQNDYVGLMSKKNKDRLGSQDFNVQHSFALGGAAFNIQEARAEMLDVPQDANGR